MNTTSSVECANCGASVTNDYARVFSSEPDPETVDCCPRCPDRVRTAENRVREARSTRRNARGVRE